MPKFGFCFTLNNYTPEQEQALRGAVGSTGILYMLYGREVAPTTGTPHLQGYLQCNHKKMQRINTKLGIFVQAQKGTATQASDYCKKDGDFVESGDFDASVPGLKGKGARSDLEAVKKAVMDGKEAGRPILPRYYTLSIHIFKTLGYATVVHQNF